ncbi:hypothetical protein LEP1GSC168_0876 [Leptospira santarosai str. HAI134]|nr:hypothetical protein LEP1GSC168_0876 [Leptospira santarosai str. HAI134]
MSKILLQTMIGLKMNGTVQRSFVVSLKNRLENESAKLRPDSSCIHKNCFKKH